MQPEPVIATAVAHFKRSQEAEAAKREAMTDAKLDTRLAEREGDEGKVAEAIEAETRSRSDWYAQYLVMREAAKSIADALGVSASDLKSAL